MTNCPLCEQEIKKSKVVYRHVICKKCWAGYINRRQVAYIIDALILFGAFLLVGVCLGFAMITVPSINGGWIVFAISIPLYLIWLSRDALGGRSPGKVCMNLATLDNSSGAAIGFRQAFLRNWPLAIAKGAAVIAALLVQLGVLAANEQGITHIEFSGLLMVVVVITIAIQMNKGPRWGDGLANTRVIWRRYVESPVFNPALAQSLAAPPEFAPAIRSNASESTNDPYRAPRS